MFKNKTKSLIDSPLGKNSSYPDQYDASILVPIPRVNKREEIGIQNHHTLPFTGYDFWTGYELSWLNLKGKPEVGILHCEIPCESSYIIESKSFKLYLNSFNQTRVGSSEILSETILKDLSEKLDAQIQIKIQMVNDQSFTVNSHWTGENIDHYDVEIDEYTYNPALLNTESPSSIVSEELFSHLLKSNCLVTGQPDWGSVWISYKGPKINHKQLLKYLISFRKHEEFHEQCVERIFVDLIKYCSCETLTVYARYLRRGGLDINPLRSNDPYFDPNQFKNIRLLRQ